MRTTTEGEMIIFLDLMCVTFVLSSNVNNIVLGAIFVIFFEKVKDPTYAKLNYETHNEICFSYFEPVFGCLRLRSSKNLQKSATMTNNFGGANQPNEKYSFNHMSLK